jgi:HPt (histidine-containing phosphotransfer) domain-containing protein
MTDATPAVDPGAMEQLLEMTGGDRAFLDELIETYLEDAGIQLQAMRAAAQLGSAEDMIRPAHSLKGNSLNVGAEKLAEQCRQLEIDGRSGAVDQAADRVEAAVDEFERVRAELMRIRITG